MEKHPGFGVSGALDGALENTCKRSIHTPVRTEIRSRSPRLTASSLSKKASKGSRQIGSVTLGKGLALRVGHVGSIVCNLMDEVELLDRCLHWSCESLR